MFPLHVYVPIPVYVGTASLGHIDIACFKRPVSMIFGRKVIIILIYSVLVSCVTSTFLNLRRDRLEYSKGKEAECAEGGEGQGET